MAGPTAKEVVKEHVIFVRERNFNLRVESYYVSKLLVLMAIGLIQSLLLFMIVRIFCGSTGEIPGQWLTFAALTTCGTTLGLLISTISRTEEVATALVPVVVIPQIILAGVIVTLSRDSGFAFYLAYSGISSFWGQRSLEALLPRVDQIMLNEPDRPFIAQLAVLCYHAFVFIALTLTVLVIQSRQSRR